MIWQSMESAPREPGKPILAWCLHEAGLSQDDKTYAMTVEGLDYVPNGCSVIEWGGDREEDGDDALPDFWFVFGTRFGVVAFPLAWAPIPAMPTIAYEAALAFGRVAVTIAGKETQERIVGVAIQETAAETHIGIAPERHHDIINGFFEKTGRRRLVGKQGFWTNQSRFVSREEAWIIARAAGQIIETRIGDRGVEITRGIPETGTLYSEDVW